MPAPVPMTLDQLDSYGAAVVANAAALTEDAEALIAAGRYPIPIKVENMKPI